VDSAKLNLSNVIQIKSVAQENVLECKKKGRETLAKLIFKNGKKFLEITKVCNKCGKFTTYDEPLEGITSRGYQRFYKLNPVDTCGNCGASL